MGTLSDQFSTFLFVPGYSESMSENQWDARGYAENARFVSDLGMPVVEWLAPVPGETILDLGCGDGALTAKLAAGGVEVFGIDNSASMIEAAQKLGLNVAVADMHAFQLDRQFDAVFTNAVLHWTKDIDAVLAQVASHLKPGSRFVGEFGGFGNVAAIVVAMRAAVGIHGEDDMGFSWYYPTPDEFSKSLRAHGFEPERIELIPRPTPLPNGMAGWLKTFALPFVAHLKPARQQAVLDTAMMLLSGVLKDKKGNWTADYVRLRFHAVLSPAEQA